MWFFSSLTATLFLAAHLALRFFMELTRVSNTDILNFCLQFDAWLDMHPHMFFFL